MIVYFQVPLISWRDGKANSHQCYNGKAETEPGLFHSVFSTCHPASLFPFTERPSIINALQLNKWDPNLHISALLENAHLPPPSHPNASTSPDPSHLISLILISSQAFWCSLRSPWGGRVRCGLPPSKSSRHLCLILLYVTQGRSQTRFVKAGVRKKRLTVREDALRGMDKRQIFRVVIRGAAWLLSAGVVEQGD